MAPSNPIAELRRFVRPRPPAERCELCSLGLLAEHAHLLEPAGGKLLCCCDPCALLFSGQQATRYRRVPSTVERLSGFRMTDDQWEGLFIPINLAFLFQSSITGGPRAYYPSPAGATESLLELATWHELVRENVVLQEFEPDVEALLVYRLGPAREYYRTPIDLCYKLVGTIRTHWRGLSGGTEVWAEIARFFAQLKERASHARS
jgi:hypothetical protein